MKLVRYARGSHVSVGALEDSEEIVDLSEVAHQAGIPWPGLDPMVTIIEHWNRISAILKSGIRGTRLHVADVQILAPIGRPPKNVICVGKNYPGRDEEVRKIRGKPYGITDVPIFFTKPYTAIIGPNEPIVIDSAVSRAIDYEGELAVVIGQRVKNWRGDDLRDVVFGVTLLNDVTARDLLVRHVQNYKGKGLDTFCPLGPCILTLDEVPDIRDLRLSVRVNGELRQEGLLGSLIFSIPQLIESLSAGMTLEPGDILATGSPLGTGASFDPPRFLKEGDVVEISVPQIGTLVNPVVEKR